MWYSRAGLPTGGQLGHFALGPTLLGGPKDRYTLIEQSNALLKQSSHHGRASLLYLALGPLNSLGSPANQSVDTIQPTFVQCPFLQLSIPHSITELISVHLQRKIECDEHYTLHENDILYVGLCHHHKTRSHLVSSHCHILVHIMKMITNDVPAQILGAMDGL